jgi:RND family efflux transporter MFP subunit
MAERQSERFKRLAAEKVVTARDLEMTLVAEAGARARHEAAQAAVRMSEENLGYAVLHSPVNGRVVRRLARSGDLAAPGRPLLVVEAAGAPEVRVTVPMNGTLTPVAGMPAEILVADRALPAVVDRVVPDGSGHVTEAYLRAEGLDLPSGAFVRGALLGPETETLRVPADALLRRGALTGVFLAADGRAVLRWLRLSADGRVLSGLAPGDSVILAPPVTLHDGDPVEVAR